MTLYVHSRPLCSVNELLGHALVDVELAGALRDGQLLCQLMNLLLKKRALETVAWQRTLSPASTAHNLK
jgi:hypothetical protein